MNKKVDNKSIVVDFYKLTYSNQNTTKVLYFS